MPLASSPPSPYPDRHGEALVEGEGSALASACSRQRPRRVATAVVVVVIAVTKFTHGAWIVVVVTPVMIVGFYTIRRHYDSLRGQLTLRGFVPPKIGRHPVVVLVEACTAES